MNAKIRLLVVLSGLITCYAQANIVPNAATTTSATTNPAHVQDWTDTVSDSISNAAKATVQPMNSLIQDPLFTRPSTLKQGVILPGDQDSLSCTSANINQNESNPLTLAQAMDVALCHNPQLQGTWATIKVQAAALGEARAAYLPTITGSISRMRDHTHTPNNPLQSSTTLKNTTEYASLSWRLFDFGGRAANRRSVADLLDAALADHNAALQKILTNVISAYFDAQTAQATQISKLKIEQYAQATLDAAQRREARGAGAESDTLQAATALSKARLDRSRAQGTYQKDLSILLYALGLPESTHLTLGVDLVDQSDHIKQDLNSWLQQAQAQHPAILAAQAQVDAAKEKVTSTRSEGLPSLDLTGNFYQNGRPNQGLNPTKTDETLAGLTLNIPLFSGFGQTYKIRGAQAQVEQKEAALQDTEQQILMDVVKAHADAMAAADNLQYSQDLLTSAQKALATVQRKFDKGASDILDVLSTQSALADAEQQRIQCLAEWRSARLRLLASVGGLGLSGAGN